MDETSRQHTSVDIQVNGNDSGAPVGGDATWHTIFNTPGSNLSSVSAEYIPGASASIRSIRVDGSILVDKASFGANGFYLPFDPTNTGANYGTEYIELFNGTALTDSAIQTDGYFAGVGATQTFDNLINIAPTTSIQLQGYAMQNGTLSINDESPISLNMALAAGQTAVGYTQVIPYSGAITKLVVVADAAANLGVGQLVIDGVTLINHSSIGVDASGKQNNFYDQNFGVGNTSQVWSNGGDNSELRSSSSWENVFNGYNPAQQTSKTTAYIEVNKSATLKFSSEISGNIIVCASSAVSSTATNGTITIGGESQTVTNTDTSQVEYIFSNKEDVTEMIVTGGTITAASGLEIIYIKLNGELLVDPSYLDTVTDTPVMNYAVLNQGLNGNLVSALDGIASHRAGSSSISFTTGKKYFEFTSVSLLNNIILDDGGNGDWAIIGDGRLYIGGSIVNSNFVNWTDNDLIGLALDADSDTFDVFVNGTLQNSYNASGNPPSTYSVYGGNDGTGSIMRTNYGQQPFAASNVTYDQATGIVQIDSIKQPYDYRANTSQVWSTTSVTATTAFNTGNEAEKGFDGNRDTVALLDDNNGDDGGVITITFSPPLSGKVELGINPGRKLSVNGGTQVTSSGTLSSGNGPLFDLGTYGTVNSIEIKSVAGGYPASFSVIQVGGRLLVDTGVWDASQNWSDTVSSSASFEVDRGPEKAFNGLVSQNNNDNCNGGNGATLNWTGYTPGSYSVRVWGFRREAQSIDYYTLDSSGNAQNKITSKDVIGTNNTYGWLNFGTVSDFTGIRCISTDSVTGPIVGAIEINGAILVDSGAQWNTSQLWSDNLTDSNGAFKSSYPATNAFDGIVSAENTARASASDTTTTFSPANGIAYASKVEVWTYFSGNVSINGLGAITVSDDQAWRTIATGSGTLINLKFVSVGSDVYVGGIRVDGKILVDSDIATYSTLFETWDDTTVTGIYYYDKNQSKIITSFELNRTYGIRTALNSAGIYNLEFQPTRTVLDYISCDGVTYLPIEDTSTGLRTVTSLNSDLTLKLDRLETAFEAVLARVFALDSVEIGPLAINGYYPLYYTAAGANAASPTTTNHTHLINGITYYMPDGVTIYHGTYGSSSGSSSSGGGGSYY